MPTPREWVDSLPNPKVIGQSEYTVIHEFLRELVDNPGMDFQLIEAVLVELEDCVQHHLDTIAPMVKAEHEVVFQRVVQSRAQRLGVTPEQVLAEAQAHVDDPEWQRRYQEDMEWIRENMYRLEDETP